MSYSETSTIYTLSDFQLRNLIEASNGRVTSFAVVQPALKDDEELRAKLENYTREVEDLVKLGLAEDISGDFQAAILQKREESGRGFTIYTVTETGYLMFHGHKKRIPN